MIRMILSADVAALIARRSKMPLTTCRICGKALRDANSVSLGIGPVCRKRHGYESKLDAVKRELRPLVAAALRSCTAATDGEDVIPELSILRTLGFASIADAIERRMALVEITYEADAIHVSHGYCPEIWHAIRAAGGRWNKDEKRHELPRAGRPFLTAALRKTIPGRLGWSNTGGLFCVHADPIVTKWSLTSDTIDGEALAQAAALLATSDRADVRDEADKMQALATGDNGTQTDWRANIPLAEDFYAI